MANHLWSVLCGNSSTDELSHNISLFDVTEQITLDGIPVNEKIILPTKFHLVITWMRSDLSKEESIVVKIGFQSPNKEITIAGEIQVDLKTFIRGRSILVITGLPLSGPGMYNFVVEYRDINSNTWQSAPSFPLQVEYSNIKPVSDSNNR